MIEAGFFYFFSACAILSALAVILHPSPTRALLALVASMFSLAVLFTLLQAYFVAVVHLIIYAGAILVLFLYVIMLQGIGAREIPFRERFVSSYMAGALLGGGAFTAGLLFLLATAASPSWTGVVGSAAPVGRLLFQKYLLPFETASLLLLLGVFAAVALARREDKR
jgi:NADH-quinone oxidoreductase subunit J